MVNGCGATTLMEMLIVFKDTVEFLAERGVTVVGNMVGEILTVQESGGFQLNMPSRPSPLLYHKFVPYAPLSGT